MGDSNSSLIFDLILISGICALFLIRRWLNNRPLKKSKYDISETDDDTSLIITMFTIGVGLKKVTEGTLINLPYKLLITTNVDIPVVEKGEYIPGLGELNVSHKDNNVPTGMVASPEGQIIMDVNLPAKSSVHLAGFSLKDETFRSLLGNTSQDNTMVQVQLEGDFPDYFKLLCEKGKEIELREVLDPTRMQFLVDFCESYNFELVGSDLYFTEANSTKNSSNETLVQAAQDFTLKILPTLQRMTSSLQ